MNFVAEFSCDLTTLVVLETTIQGDALRAQQVARHFARRGVLAVSERCVVLLMAKVCTVFVFVFFWSCLRCALFVGARTHANEQTNIECLYVSETEIEITEVCLLETASQKSKEFVFWRLGALYKNTFFVVLVLGRTNVSQQSSPQSKSNSKHSSCRYQPTSTTTVTTHKRMPIRLASSSRLDSTTTRRRIGST